jgi:hypothetical protein
MIYYSTILTRRYPGATWSLEAEDYETLNWQDELPKPTQQELDAEWESVKAEVEAEAKAKEDVRTSALAKLAKLGLTEDEVKAVIGL